MKHIPTGWDEYKLAAKTFGVSYSTFYRRIQQGMHPMDAATIKPIDPSERMRQKRTALEQNLQP